MSIHTIEIEESTELPELKKLFRKKLMTGGAVLRLQAGLDTKALHELFQRFSPDALEHNIASMVLREIAKSPNLSQELKSLLEETNIVSVQRTLEERSLSPNE